MQMPNVRRFALCALLAQAIGCDSKFDYTLTIGLPKDFAATLSSVVVDGEVEYIDITGYEVVYQREFASYADASALTSFNVEFDVGGQVVAMAASSFTLCESACAESGCSENPSDLVTENVTQYGSAFASVDFENLQCKFADGIFLQDEP